MKINQNVKNNNFINNRNLLLHLKGSSLCKGKFILVFLFLIINLKFCSTQNSTTCHEMYLSNLTDVKCLNTTACCYMEYTFMTRNFTKCILKVNETEDMCSSMGDVSYKESVDMIVCSCYSGFLACSATLYFAIFLIFGFL